ncbi:MULTISPECIES: fimbrial protein [Aeromonas]|uniref:Type 1 fimbrial protein n=1 Tax=Aeromonas caviae TaxID=648 RepID=A0AA42RC76_AERCA|nr:MULTISPECIES: fimbrial protein [Aeromonas]MDH1507873.1 type 1 fimbrial protein [Aeromonas caviae]MDH1805637.1 type 1 fimbrial protein [Aeromonas caviae]RWT33498.1 type 1 fimbrial protein [Aeromonas caviae]
MQLNLRLALISALALLPRISHATDGEINITGTIVANTCDITSGTGGKHAVVLPTVSANALTAAGTTAGRTPIAINLTNCTPNSGKVSLYFEPGSGTDMSTGKLKNTAPSGAGNVQVGLSNADFSQIALNQPQAAQNSQWVDITGGAATLTYFAEYYSALGGVTAGAVKADTFFTLTYQ